MYRSYVKLRKGNKVKTKLYWAVITGFLFFGSFGVASATSVSFDLDSLEGTFGTLNSAWSGGTYLGKEQNISFGGSFPSIQSFTLEFSGTVSLPQYIDSTGNTYTSSINTNFNFWEQGYAGDKLNYGISLALRDSSFQNIFTGYSYSYNISGNSFQSTLTMTRDFGSTQNWDAGFPTGDVWTGLVFMWGWDAPWEERYLPGIINVTEASITFTDEAAAPVPEPTTMLLFGTGIAGLAGTRLRRKKKLTLL